MTTMAVSLSKPNRLSTRLKNMVVRFLPNKAYSTGELIELIQNSEPNDESDGDIHSFMESALKASALRVRDVMVPRAHMVTVNSDSSLDEILELVTENGHSRIPVLNKNSDDEAVGILLVKNLLAHVHEAPQNGEEFHLIDTLLDPIFVPESMRLNPLLRKFKQRRSHMAIVVNEYNGIAGLVTLEDVLEEFVGEIEDESDPHEEEPIRKLEHNVYIVDALTVLDEFNQHFNSNIGDDVDTIGGVVLKLAGRVPKVGARYEYEGFQFEVLEANQRKVSFLRVSRSQ